MIDVIAELISAFGYEFFRNALLAGILASTACGIIGSFVVIKRMVSLTGVRTSLFCEASRRPSM